MLYVATYIMLRPLGELIYGKELYFPLVFHRATAILRARGALVAMGAAEMIGALAGTVEESMGGSSGGVSQTRS